MPDDEQISKRHAIGAVGWISAELAGRADAWNGNAPAWFPEPPEWLELFEKGLEAAREDVPCPRCSYSLVGDGMLCTHCGWVKLDPDEDKCLRCGDKGWVHQDSFGVYTPCECREEEQ